MIECKVVRGSELMEKVMEEAKTQVRDKKYRQELEKRGVQDILELAIVVDGKTVLLGRVCKKKLELINKTDEF